MDASAQDSAQDLSLALTTTDGATAVAPLKRRRGRPSPDTALAAQRSAQVATAQQVDSGARFDRATHFGSTEREATGIVLNARRVKDSHDAVIGRAIDYARSLRPAYSVDIDALTEDTDAYCQANDDFLARLIGG